MDSRKEHSMTARNYLLAAITGAVLMQSVPAFAGHDDDDDDDHGYRRHRHHQRHIERHYRQYYEYGRGPVLVEPEVVYLPPPAVVYQPAPPPPVVYQYGGYDDGRTASMLFGAALGAYFGHAIGHGR